MIDRESSTRRYIMAAENPGDVLVTGPFLSIFGSGFTISISEALVLTVKKYVYET